MKILITGGHVTPAIAIIDEIKQRFPDWEMVFVGRKYAMEGEREVSAEYRLISDLGIRFLSLNTGRSTAIGSSLKFLYGLVQAFWYVMKERPAIIVSFGGYVALPVVMAGSILRIPSITHEQTMTLGLANKYMLPFVKKICVTYPQVIDEYKLPKEKTVHTGLPLRKELFMAVHKELFPVSIKYPLLYVAGGATGSESINSMVLSILPELLNKYTIVHQTGYASFPSIQKKSEKIPEHLKARYHIVPYLPVSDLAWVYKHARLYIGRSGANTITELAVLGKVAILIPLPWSAGKEQEKNALWLVAAGSAVILFQDSVSEKLLLTIRQVFETFDILDRRAKEFSKTIPRDGASRMVSEIASICK